jgi:hypothetical protein
MTTEVHQAGTLMSRRPAEQCTQKCDCSANFSGVRQLRRRRCCRAPHDPNGSRRTVQRAANLTHPPADQSKGPVSQGCNSPMMIVRFNGHPRNSSLVFRLRFATPSDCRLFVARSLPTRFGSACAPLPPRPSRSSQRVLSTPTVEKTRNLNDCL